MRLFHRPGRPKLVTASVTACAMGALLLPAASTAAPAPSRSESTTTAVAAQTSALQAAAPGRITSRVRGTFGRAGRVRGTFSPDRFFVRGGENYANGVLHATLRRGNGDLVGRVDRRITIPVRGGSAEPAAATAALAPCRILHLVLGPLDLDLLGLEVHLNRVVLDVVARPGPGNLLGNLLCAVAGLLDRTGIVNQLRLANLLNRILAILRV